MQCLDKAQRAALGNWCRTAAVDDELQQWWSNEDWEPVFVVVRRVA